MLAGASDAIVAISPAIRDELLDGHHIGVAAQYRVVPLGFDLAPFAAVDAPAREAARRDLNLPQGAPVVATVGRLTAIKQHRLFLDVIKQVVSAHPNAIALVAGDGELRSDLEAYAASLGITGNVRFLGWRRDLATIYGATDVFLLTSRNEGTPVALIEAMASGVPWCQHRRGRRQGRDRFAGVRAAGAVRGCQRAGGARPCASRRSGPAIGDGRAGPRRRDDALQHRPSRRRRRRALSRSAGAKLG